MKRIIGEYPIFDGETNAECIATLCSPICPEHIDDFENLWRPAMKERVAQATSISEVTAANLEDAHWHWREKQIDREHRLDWDSFVVECEGVAQGMMFVKTFGFARAAGQKHLPLIYIDLVSVAPWNRVGLTSIPKYKGIGRLLIGAGLSLSVHEDFGGRLGLHSLPQSESYYRDQCKMSELGPDPDKQLLIYFEFTPEQAQDYLNT